jgi:hypothetical protein
MEALMSRYVGLHTLPGFTREMLAGATPTLEQMNGEGGSPHFLRAYSAFRQGKVVCEWESPSEASVIDAYAKLGFPYDEIVEVEAICDAGDEGVGTRYV